MISEHELPADKLELMAVVVQIHRSRCAVVQTHMEPLVTHAKGRQSLRKAGDEGKATDSRFSILELPVERQP
jgi:hypothetical protein